MNPGGSVTDDAREGLRRVAQESQRDLVKELLVQADEAIAVSKVYAANPSRAPLWDNCFVQLATICNLRDVPVEFADCREEIMVPARYARARIRSSNGIDQMRNAAVKMMLEHRFTHILMLDVDMIYPPDTLHRLVMADKDIVAGIACDRLPAKDFNGEATFRQTFAHRMPESGRFFMAHMVTMPSPPSLYRCGRVSMGGCLIKRHVFEKMKRPWFFDGVFQKMPSGENHRVGEDVYFFTKAQEAGFEVWCDTSLRYGHLVAAAVYPTQDAAGNPGYAIRPTEVLQAP